MGPEIIPILTILGALIVAGVGKLSRRLCELLSVLFAFGAAALSVMYLIKGWHGEVMLFEKYFTFYSDSLSLFMLAVVNILGSLIVLYSVGYMSHDKDYIRYYFLILLFIGAMSGLVLAGDIVLLYIFWEIVGICSALLISYWWEKPEARRAGLKAFAVTRVGDFGMLFGIALIILHLHNTNIQYILESGLNGQLAFIVGLLLFIGAVGKSAQFPLYVWLPDAMEGPTSVSALIHAATMVKAGVYLVSRFYPLISGAPGLLEIISWTAIITIIISGFSALAANDIKKVLAYSTINHLAIMFAALGLGGWIYAQLHLLSHSLFKALLFLCAGLIVHEVGTRSLDGISGLWNAGLKITTTAFLIGSLSLAGIPPFPGFVTKEHVLGLIEEHLPHSISYPLAFTISFVSAMYIFRLFFKIALGKSEKKLHEKDPFMLTPIILLATATAIGIVFLTPTASLFEYEIELFEASIVPIVGTILGLALAWVFWGAGYGKGVKEALRPLADLAERGFLLDDVYTGVARFVTSNVSRIVVKIQTGVPSVNVLWIILFLLILALVSLGVI